MQLHRCTLNTVRAGDVGLYRDTAGEWVSGESPLYPDDPIREGRRAFKLSELLRFEGKPNGEVFEFQDCDLCNKRSN
jgi:hypothetical protein